MGGKGEGGLRERGALGVVSGLCSRWEVPCHHRRGLLRVGPRFGRWAKRVFRRKRTSLPRFAPPVFAGLYFGWTVVCNELLRLLYLGTTLGAEEDPRHALGCKGNKEEQA